MLDYIEDGPRLVHQLIIGITSEFFTHFWHIIGNYIFSAVKSFFHLEFLLKSVNETLISLIPKIEHPYSRGHFKIPS